MCGIFGIHSLKPLNNKQANVMYDLGIQSMQRGVDSSGIIGVRPKGPKSTQRKVKWRKSFALWPDFFNEKETNLLLRGDGLHTLLGHTRHGTAGDYSLDNAHPHRHRSIIGMHNGTINSFKPLDKLWDKGSKTHYPNPDAGVSDSRILFKRMYEEGVLSTLRAADSGAYALQWVERGNQPSLNFIRNADRTLYFATDEDGIVYWYSEGWALKGVLERNGVKIANGPEILPTHTQLSFNLRTGKVTRTPMDIHVPIKHSYVPFKEVAPVSQLPAPSSTTKSLASALAKLDEERGDELSVYQGFNGEIVDPRTLETRASHGCAGGCNRQCDPDEDVMYWINTEQYVCQVCFEQPAIAVNLPAYVYQGQWKDVFDADIRWS